MLDWLIASSIRKKKISLLQSALVWLNRINLVQMDNSNKRTLLSSKRKARNLCILKIIYPLAFYLMATWSSALTQVKSFFSNNHVNSRRSLRLHLAKSSLSTLSLPTPKGSLSEAITAQCCSMRKTQILRILTSYVQRKSCSEICQLESIHYY